MRPPETLFLRWLPWHACLVEEGVAGPPGSKEWAGLAPEQRDRLKNNSLSLSGFHYKMALSGVLFLIQLSLGFNGMLTHQRSRSVAIGEARHGVWVESLWN